MTKQSYKYVGKPRKLVEGMGKVTGHVRYVADLKVPGMLYARPVLSPYAHALIVSIDKSAALAMPGVVAVLTAQDLPTKDRPITSRNSAILAKGKVLFVGQPVVVVVAESEMAAADAAEAVRIEYEPLPVVVDLLKAIKPDTPLVWPLGVPKAGAAASTVHSAVVSSSEANKQKINNVYHEYHFKRGDVAAGFTEADVVVERTYRTSVIHQGYMEPHACVAEPDALGRELTVYTSTQGQFLVRDEVAQLLSMPTSRVRIVPMTVGGAFGAKYGILEPLTSAVAMALKRPVRIVLSRSEDFLATTPAPETMIELKTGAKQDGSVTAIQARVFIDNGAFAFYYQGGTLCQLLGGYYKWPNLQIDCYEVHTNKTPTGAYRAPSAPPATFAIESNMHDMVYALGQDQLDFRLQNAAESGDLMGDGTPWPSIGLKKCLERLRASPAWWKTTSEAKPIQPSRKKPNEGVGLAIGGWSVGLGTAEAICKVENDGFVTVQVGALDISGVNSSFVLIAAEVLGVVVDKVRLITNDTTGLYGLESGGSKVTYSVAGAVQMAATEAKKKLLEVASDELEASTVDIELVNGHAQVKGAPSHRVPIGTLATIARYKRGGTGPIGGYGHSAIKENAPAFVAHLVKVTVDPETGTVQPTEYLAVQDVGFAINPMMVEGQMHGGMVQGLSMGLHEAMRYDEHGQLISGSFMDYCLPRASQMPSLEPIMLENPSPYGPFGARGVGEPPIVAGAAAVANAIKDATGVRMTQLPIRPEQLWQALLVNEK